jgi:hypothetical protein
MATNINATEIDMLQNYIARGRAGVHAQTVKLTPSLAQYLADMNPDNRNVSNGRVDAYAKDIAAGRWEMNGEPVILSREGLLNDGQHRCLAVIKSGIPIDTMMVFGVDRESRKTTDVGAAKSAANFLAMDAVANAATLAGVARLALSYEQYGSVATAGRITNAEVLSLVQIDEVELAHVAKRAAHFSGKLQGIAAPSVWGWTYYQCRKINARDADQFFESLATGEMLASNDPAYVVRQRLLGLGRVNRSIKSEVILHGWNAFRRGQTRSIVRVCGNLPTLV